MQVTIHGEAVSISLKEKLLRSIHVLTPEEKKRHARYGDSMPFDFTGALDKVTINLK